MNLLHVDYKGVLPDFEQWMKLPDFWKECGYDGLILEYEDRIDFTTLPGLRRGGFSSSEHSEFLLRCRALGLEIVPLIQVHGHLEWMLNLNYS